MAPDVPDRRPARPPPSRPRRSRGSARRSARPRCCPPGPTTTRRVYDWEVEEIFLRDWIAVGRAEEVPEPTSFILRDVLGENVIIVRGRDGVIRAFYNVCRHRGTAVEERECGKAVRFQCPYHAWIYDLDGSPRPRQAHRGPRGLQLRHVRADRDPLRDLGRLRLPVLRRRGRHAAAARVPGRLVRPPRRLRARHEHAPARGPPDLRRRRQLEDRGRELQRVLPLPAGPQDAQPAHALRPGRGLPGRGAVEGRLDAVRRGLRDDVDQRHARRPAAALRPRRGRGAADLLLHPVAEPDRVGAPGLRPHAPGVAGRPEPQHRPLRPLRRGGPAGHRSTSAAPSSSGTSPTARTTTWWRCSSRGRGRRSWTAGRYSNQEASVHAFDIMVADRYANDGSRTVRGWRTETASDRRLVTRILGPAQQAEAAESAPE